MLPYLAAGFGKLFHMPLFGHKMWFSAAPATALVYKGLVLVHAFSSQLLSACIAESQHILFNITLYGHEKRF